MVFIKSLVSSDQAAGWVTEGLWFNSQQ